MWPRWDRKWHTSSKWFDITVASEIMAVFCLASDIEDLQKRIGNIVIGYTRSNEPVRAKQLNAEGAITALLKDAFQPNLVQTLENNPAFMHGAVSYTHLTLPTTTIV